MSQQAKAFRTLIYTLLAGPVLIGAAVYSVLNRSTAKTPFNPPLAVVAAQVVVAVVLHFVCEASYRRVQPLGLDLSEQDAPRQAFARFMASVVMRFALCEGLIIVSLVAAFVVSSGGYGVYLVGFVLGEALLLIHAYPWRRPVLKTQARLDADGRRGALAEAFGISE
ncbi:MAG: hypothetical protein FWD74_01400 [Actinomycetia bacterium]|nr:hypothetical protein [Actinomycetes bacterium]